MKCLLAAFGLLFVFSNLVSQNFTGKDIFQVVKQGNYCISVNINGNSNTVNINQETKRTRDLVRLSKLNNQILLLLLDKAENISNAEELSASFEQIGVNLKSASGLIVDKNLAGKFKVQANTYLQKAIAIKCHKDEITIQQERGERFYISDNLSKSEFEIFEEKEGIRSYRYNNGYGYVDFNNTILLDPILDFADGFSEGLALVRDDDKYFFITKHFKAGKFEIAFTADLPRKVTKINAVHCGIIVNEYEDGTKDFGTVKDLLFSKYYADVRVNSDCNTVFVKCPAFAYTFNKSEVDTIIANPQKENIIKLLTDHGFLKENLIYSKRKEVKPFLSNFWDEKDITIAFDAWGLMDKNEKWILPPSFQLQQIVTSTLFLANNVMVNTKDLKQHSDILGLIEQNWNLSALIETSGKIRTMYIGEISDFSEGIATVNGKFNIDTAGNEFNKDKFDNCKEFKNGVAIIKKNNKCGLMNKYGTYILEPVYDDILQYGNNKYEATLQEKKYFYEVSLFNKKPVE